MKIKKILIIFALSFSLICIIPNPSFAQTPPDQNDNQRIKYLLNITPAIINFEITPGKKQTFEVEVQNFLDKPMGLRANLEPFAYSDQTSDYLKQTELLKWVKLPSEFIADANSKKVFQIEINVPSNAIRGGQYGVVFLTPFYSHETDSPTILSKVGLLLIGTYGKTDFTELKKKCSSQFRLPFFN